MGVIKKIAIFAIYLLQSNMNEEEITLDEAQRLVDGWIIGFGGGYFSKLTNMAILAEETGEVARVMARLYGDQVPKNGDKLELADELADVLWVTLAIANQTGINITKAFNDNLKKKCGRDRNRFVR